MSLQTEIIPDWIAVDWGTTRLRAWAMRNDGTEMAEALSDKGMGTLDKSGFEPALLELISPWLGSGKMLVLACGMVGARQGWIEAPYAQAPCAPLSPDLTRPETRDPRLDVRIVPGVMQPDPADVMRGEETQIAGFIATEPRFYGVLCLPGTHTKWVQIANGRIERFQTVMTGEMFSCISKHTVLRHTIAPEGWDAEGFAAGVAQGIAHPERLAALLFGLRAENLLSGLAPQTARARLSGLLMGLELAATREFWLGQDVVLIGDPALAAHYTTALAAQGVTPRGSDANALVRVGLTAAHALLKVSPS